MSTTKHTTIEQLKKLALRTKSEIGLVDAKVAGLTTKVNDLVTAGGEPNKLEGIKVNGTLLALTDKIANHLIHILRPGCPFGRLSPNRGASGDTISRALIPHSRTLAAASAAPQN